MHGEDDYRSAVEASEILFGKGTAEQLAQLDEPTFLAVFEGVPQFHLSAALLNTGVSLIDLLAVHTTIMESKGEARKMLTAGAVSVNKTKWTEGNDKVNESHLINNKYLLIQKGKKNYFLIHIS